MAAELTRSQNHLVVLAVGFCCVYFFSVARCWLHRRRGEVCGRNSGGSGKYFASLVLLGLVLFLWQWMKAVRRGRLALRCSSLPANGESSTEPLRGSFEPSYFFLPVFSKPGPRHSQAKAASTALPYSGDYGGLPFPLDFIALRSPGSSWCLLLSAGQRQSYEPMLVASCVFSLIKILNSSIFDKIWVFSAEPGSLYGNS